LLRCGITRAVRLGSLFFGGVFRPHRFVFSFPAGASKSHFILSRAGERERADGHGMIARAASFPFLSWRGNKPVHLQPCVSLSRPDGATFAVAAAGVFLLPMRFFSRKDGRPACTIYEPDARFVKTLVPSFSLAPAEFFSLRKGGALHRRKDFQGIPGVFFTFYGMRYAAVELGR